MLQVHDYVNCFSLPTPSFSPVSFLQFVQPHHTLLDVYCPLSSMRRVCCQLLVLPPPGFSLNHRFRPSLFSIRCLPLSVLLLVMSSTTS